MKAIAALAMRGPVHAAGVTGLFGVLGLMLPPLSWVSGAVVGLSTLRHGRVQGFKVLALATAITAVASALAIGSPARILGLVVAVWLPAWLLSLLLRATDDQGRMLMGAAALAALFALGMRALTDDVVSWWRERLTEFADLAAQQGGHPAFDPRAIDGLAVVMNSAAAGGLVISLMVTMLLARSWEAMLVKPGGFREEFHRLRLPRWLTVCTAVLLALVVIGWRSSHAVAHGPAMDLLVIALIAYMFVGLAVCHQRVFANKRSVAWLIALYVLLVLQPHVIIVGLAATGLADSYVDFRRLGHTGRRSNS